MKKLLIILCALVFSGTVLVAQEVNSTKDTLVVVVKHEVGDGFFEIVGKPFKKGYKVTENAFVEPFTDAVAESRMYRHRYRADLELSWANPNHWGISTSHGRSYGNGLYVGGGAGFYAITEDNTTYYTPVVADVKYIFINRLASPFVNTKAGGLIDITNSGIRTFINPALGIDIARFSIKLGCEYQLGCLGFGKGIPSGQVRSWIYFLKNSFCALLLTLKILRLVCHFPHRSFYLAAL